MDFWLTDDHEALQEGIRSFVEGRFPLDATAGREETDAVVDLEKWRELGELACSRCVLTGSTSVRLCLRSKNSAGVWSRGPWY